MPLNSLTEVQLRLHCREAVEALELWLRRVIDISLEPRFGPNYINAKSSTDGKLVIDEKVSRGIKGRFSKDEKRYPRIIDAMTLEDEIKIICDRVLYEKFFREYFEKSFKFGYEQLGFYLQKIKDLRNPLSHANPISVRKAEQAICYSNDIIDSIKDRLKEKNLDREYNVPMIIKVHDSRGFTFHNSHIKRNNTGRGSINLCENQPAWLWSGDKFGVEVEIDPSFSSEEYSVNWIFPEGVKICYKSDRRVVLSLTDANVSVNFTIYCRVISNKSWHRCGDVDDSVGITYKILPCI